MSPFSTSLSIPRVSELRELAVTGFEQARNGIEAGAVEAGRATQQGNVGHFLEEFCGMAVEADRMAARQTK